MDKSSAIKLDKNSFKIIQFLSIFIYFYQILSFFVQEYRIFPFIISDDLKRFMFGELKGIWDHYRFVGYVWEDSFFYIGKLIWE